MSKEAESSAIAASIKLKPGFDFRLVMDMAVVVDGQGSCRDVWGF